MRPGPGGASELRWPSNFQPTAGPSPGRGPYLPENPTGGDPMIKGGAAVWLPVTDMKRAVAFYGDTLGLQVNEHDDDWSEVDGNGLRIGLNGSASESPRGDGGALLAFQPDGELEAEVERLEGAGVEFSDAISEHPWGRIVPFKDPDGNDLQLYASPNGGWGAPGNPKLVGGERVGGRGIGDLRARGQLDLGDHPRTIGAWMSGARPRPMPV